MPVQGKIQKDIMTGQKYVFMVDGVEFVITDVGSIEETLQTVDLPDGSVASGGRVDPVEFPISIPLHHDVEYAFMELWFKGCQEPIAPNAYKNCSIVIKSNTGAKQRSMTVLGAFISGRSSPELEMEGGAGEMLKVEYTIKADKVMHS